MTSPTQRTLAECRRRGWDATITERWNSFARIRQDLWGFVDVIALDGGPRTIGIQTTSRDGASKRRAKIEASPHLPRLYAAGWVVEVWTYAKMGKRGKRKLWSLKRERLSLPNSWTVVEEPAP